ncbi:MAG: nickel-dependent hydrogenase large subunit [Thermoanaerobaculaceae bacterium]|jgi:Ni,Fe-hydrogenase I large subunit|nr:nickel-dependent hydrogenase large subunit [Thermoanaerobaculaceae bacterium]
MSRGRVTSGARTVQSVDVQKITEQVTYSRYDDADDDFQQAQGEATPVFPKGDAYSWLQASRHVSQPSRSAHLPECGSSAATSAASRGSAVVAHGTWMR